MRYREQVKLAGRAPSGSSSILSLGTSVPVSPSQRISQASAATGPALALAQEYLVFEAS